MGNAGANRVIDCQVELGRHLRDYRRNGVTLRERTLLQRVVSQRNAADEKEDSMQITTQKIMPCLWFDTQAEEAANFYAAVFKNSKVGQISRYGKEGYEIHGKKAGSVMTVEFEIEGQQFLALNGGPQFKFNEAVSFQVLCETQAEIDYFWDKLAEGGKEGPCGWLKDKFGLSWQIVPTALPQFLKDGNAETAERIMKAMLKMRKLDIAALKRAQAA
jgi:predicted 3-demethylubiquinone-9 3-methyltransferase (glyoxalase superfamily)